MANGLEDIISEDTLMQGLAGNALPAPPVEPKTFTVNGVEYLTDMPAGALRPQRVDAWDRNPNNPKYMTLEQKQAMTERMREYGAIGPHPGTSPVNWLADVWLYGTPQERVFEAATYLPVGGLLKGAGEAAKALQEGGKILKEFYYHLPAHGTFEIKAKSVEKATEKIVKEWGLSRAPRNLSIWEISPEEKEIFKYTGRHANIPEEAPKETWSPGGKPYKSDLGLPESGIAEAPVGKVTETPLDEVWASRLKSKDQTSLGFYKKEDFLDSSKYYLAKAKDADVGYILDKTDGKLAQLWNASGVKGAGKEAMADAIEKGASNLEVYGGHLNEWKIELYQRQGWKEVGKETIKDIPPGWDKSKFGQPTVVSMEWQGERTPEGIRRAVFGEKASGQSGGTPEAAGNVPGYPKPEWPGVGVEEPRNIAGRGQGYPSGSVETPVVPPAFVSETLPTVAPQTKIKGLEVRSAFGENLSPGSKSVVDWYGRHRGESSIHYNSKTGLSADFSTNCPNRLNPSRGPCPYCYVEHGRVVDKLFNMKGANKGLFEKDYGGEIANWPKDLVRELNKDGGLRMFSFADYRPGIDNQNVARTLADAKKRGLQIKAITKELKFVKEFGDHPNLRVNISVDNVPREISSNAPTIDQAIAAKAGRQNIKIRAVALNPEEAQMFAKDPRIDVVTIYHGLTNFSPNGVRHNKLLKIIAEQNPGVVKRIGMKRLQDYTDTWVNMKKPSLFDQLAEKYPTKICCQSGKCAGDRTKCGFGAAGGLMLAGVFLPIPEEE